ncbi:MAG: nitroreductase family protein [Chitinophagales bacterium]
MNPVFPFIKYEHVSYSEEEMRQRSKDFYKWLDKRRSVRMFSDKSIPEEVINFILLAASTAPSGAHKQPWTFCVVTNPEIKKQIRIAAEQEEKLSYEQRMPQEWLEDLAPLGTDWRKEFLEIAPLLIVVFKRNYEIHNGKTKNNYYVSESIGIATGLLLAAIHNAGLVSLTHTPSPMNFLKTILQRPENERPFLLIPVGYLAQSTQVPDIRRKSLQEVSEWYR